MRESAHSPDGPTTGEVADSEGCQWYRITGLQHLPPFFLSLVGSGDGWAFLSSTGAITAGRRSPDHALFPYRTAAVGRSPGSARSATAHRNGMCSAANRPPLTPDDCSRQFSEMRFGCRRSTPTSA
jgi:hypothetical protein